MRILRTSLVFSFVTLAWVFFQLPQFSDALAFFNALRTNWRLPFQPGPALVTVLYAAPVIAYHAWYLWRRAQAPGLPVGARIEPVAYGALASAILLNAGPIDVFIYFQF